MRLMMDAGLPPGVINFIPGKASVVGDICMSHPELSQVFTSLVQLQYSERCGKTLQTT